MTDFNEINDLQNTTINTTMTTAKEVRKFGYLKDLYDTNEEYENVYAMLTRGAGVDVLQQVNSSDGKIFIQSILWFDDLETMESILIEDTSDLIELDKTGMQTLDAYGEATIERNTRDLEKLVKLDSIFASTGFDFLFIEN